MMKGVDQLMTGALSLHGDEYDSIRQEALTAILTNNPNCSNIVYNVAVTLWSEIGGRAYGAGERGPEIDRTMSEICDLCHWVNFSAMVSEDGTRHGWHGNALIVFSQAATCLGRNEEALSSISVAVDAGPAMGSWTAAAETKVRILMALDRSAEAMTLVDQILVVDPSNGYALNMKEAERIDQHNAGVQQRNAERAQAPAGNANIDLSGVTISNVGEVSQKLSLQFQADVAALMAGTDAMDVKMANMQKMQAQFEANMKAIMAKLTAA